MSGSPPGDLVDELHADSPSTVQQIPEYDQSTRAGLPKQVIQAIEVSCCAVGNRQTGVSEGRFLAEVRIGNHDDFSRGPPDRSIRQQVELLAAQLDRKSPDCRRP